MRCNKQLQHFNPVPNSQPPRIARLFQPWWLGPADVNKTPRRAAPRPCSPLRAITNAVAPQYLNRDSVIMPWIRRAPALPFVDMFNPQVYWFRFPNKKMVKEFRRPNGPRYTIGNATSYATLCLDRWMGTSSTGVPLEEM
jgi:hypothetical protein